MSKQGPSRRAAIAGAGALALWAAAGAPALAGSEGFIDYEPGLVRQLQKEGRVILLDYYAEWCGTCRAQERVIRSLLKENPDYARRIALVRVDWDLYRDDDIRHRFRIPRRSTLVLLKGEQELGRIVAGTAKAQIKGLLDQGLAAAAGS